MLIAITDMLNLLRYDFMWHALIAGTLIAVLAGVVGFFVVLRQQSFAAHALSHIGFAGACAGILLHLNPVWGQLLLTAIAALLMAIMPDKMERKDTIIGLVLAFALGLGSLFLFLANSFAGSATHILFGDLLSVSTASLWLMLVLTLLCLLIMAALAKVLWLNSLLPDIAAARGLPLKIVNSLFFIVLSIAITLTAQAVGILLIFTLLIGPPAMSLQLTGCFWRGLGLSVVFNLVFVWVAIVVAGISDWPLSFCLSSLVFVSYALLWGIGKRTC